MGILVRAPKCRDGSLKNHKSIIIGKPVEWKDGVAELTEAQYEAVKGIKGYVPVVPEVIKPVITKEPEIVIVSDVIEEIVPEVTEEVPEPVIPEPEPEPIITKEPEKIIEPEPEKTGPSMIGEMPTMENTSREIREFAARQNPVIDLGKARTKIEMLREISKHFELK